MRFIKSKKSSLELSISAIVIVVLAMTLLGLGIVFIRNMISGITETSLSVQDQVRQQIMDDLRTGDKKLSFPTTEIETGIKSSKIIAFGVKNIEPQELIFTIELYLVDDTGGESLVPSGVLQQLTIGGTTKDFGTFRWNPGKQNLDINEANVYPIKFNSESFQKTATMVIKIIPDSTMGMTTLTYASKTFFVTVQ